MSVLAHSELSMRHKGFSEIEHFFPLKSRSFSQLAPARNPDMQKALKTHLSIIPPEFKECRTLKLLSYQPSITTINIQPAVYKISILHRRHYMPDIIDLFFVQPATSNKTNNNLMRLSFFEKILRETKIGKGGNHFF
ncbi:MAG: hypothetical protein KKA76_00890 [Proteobacteria bacterium]|nr:hypothetical protein [Pseudomonadota bacterium]